MSSPARTAVGGELEQPCWTGLSAGAICRRGGIGCPLPHLSDPPERWSREPYGILRRDPPPGACYPDLPAARPCPRHGRSTSYANGPAWCDACSPLRQTLQRLGLSPWARTHVRRARAAARAMALLREAYG